MARKEMTRKKSKLPNLIEDMGPANITICCPRPECGHKFTKKGAWLKKNSGFGCPECGWPISLSEEELASLFSQHVKDIDAMLERLRGDSDQ